MDRRVLLETALPKSDHGGLRYLWQAVGAV
ncbi:hypothetical protein EES45_03575 [Streptomyces sp. ADI97-07]|uniref:Uncharacterized protein n=1 Tax=Streptomyces clavifer TaxID=68188 RepID=A0ABS4V1P7_9ACTN|nr:hypothetical protein [Streptomyces clavifer]RPK84789.1 hypothetical protein EES45_03575 [Streptomyces sp. ADI97-07]